MKLSSPFAKKKKPSKAVTSRNSKAKKSKPKAKKVLAYFGMVAVLFITTVSYGGYALYQRETLKAEAGGWTYLSEGYSSIRYARACKTAVDGGAYGKLWKVTFHVYRNDSAPKVIIIKGVQGDNSAHYTSATNDGWLYGVVNGATGYISRTRNDKVYFQVKYSTSRSEGVWAAFKHPTLKTFAFSPVYLSYC